MTFRILYSVSNLVELFKVDAKQIKLWARLGTLPSLDGYRPLSFDKVEIDEWLAAGNLEKYRPEPPEVEHNHEKGFYF